MHEFEVSEKTVRRDLEVFHDAGFPLQETVGEFGRKTWRLEPGKDEPRLHFAFDEAIALYLGRRFLEPLAGTVFWDAAQRAFKKIRATFAPDALKYVDQFSTTFHQTTVGAADYTKKAELIDELMVGIEDRRAVFITYPASGVEDNGMNDKKTKDRKIRGAGVPPALRSEAERGIGK